MIQIRNFINGQWQEETGGKTVPLYNPSTGETIGSVPVSNMETCEAAIATAAEAYKTWRLVPIAKRMTYIHKIRECMIRDLEKLAQGIALDQAKHISEARGEVQRVIEIVEMACSIPALIQGETLDQIAGSITGKVTKQSLGVFGGVAPFNFPALVFGWFIPFAIGTGNTFIYKPSTQSPYFMQLMCEIFMEIGLPGGVVNVIHGSRDIPGTWYEDPRIAGVCLVGSTPTAKKMAEGCARGAKRSMLLGGAKNMLVVMEDADIDVFIENYINSCYGSAGQRCLAGSIVAIVPELYDTVLERMIEAAKKVKVGDALDPDVYMGPLISRSAADKVKEYVDIALNHGHGCELVLDGRNPELPEKNKNGYFVGPTIIKDVTPATRCSRLKCSARWSPRSKSRTSTTPSNSSGSPNSATARASSRRASSMPKSSAATPTWAWSASTWASAPRIRTFPSAASRGRSSGPTRRRARTASTSSPRTRSPRSAPSIPTPRRAAMQRSPSPSAPA